MVPVLFKNPAQVFKTGQEWPKYPTRLCMLAILQAWSNVCTGNTKGGSITVLLTSCLTV
jgi:hypothetical protein